MVFRTHRDGNIALYMCELPGLRLLRVGQDPAWNEEADWSPDGSELCYASSPDRNREVMVRDNATGATVNVSNHRANDWAPKWSPDGSHIAFLSDRAGETRLYVMKADGGDVVEVSGGPVEDNSHLAAVGITAESAQTVSQADAPCRLRKTQRRRRRNKTAGGVLESSPDAHRAGDCAIQPAAILRRPLRMRIVPAVATAPHGSAALVYRTGARCCAGARTYQARKAQRRPGLYRQHPAHFRRQVRGFVRTAAMSLAASQASACSAWASTRRASYFEQVVRRSQSAEGRVRLVLAGGRLLQG